MRTARQTLLLGGVLLRRWSRAELPGQVKRRGAGGRAVGAVLLRLLLLVLPAGVYATGQSYAALDEAVRGAAAAWGVLFLSLTVAVYGYIARAPQVRSERPALMEPILEALPIERAALSLAEMFVYVVYYVASGFFFAGLVPEGLRVLGFLSGFVFAMSVFFVGAATADLLRAMVPPERLLGVTRTLGALVSVPMLAVFLGSRLFLGAPPAWLLGALSPFAPAARAILDGSALWLPVAGAGAVFLLGRALSARASRLGADERSPVVVRVSRAGAPPVAPGNVDVLLESRERYRIALPAAVVVSIFTVMATSYVLFAMPAAQATVMAKGTVIVCLVYLGFAVLSMNLGFALRAVSRDIAARPLLVTLPLEPRAALGRREPWIARQGLVAVLPALAVPVLVRDLGVLPEATWRTAALLVAVGATGFVAPAVAFLAASAFGADSTQARSGTLERVLLVFFGLGPVAAADLASAAVSLALLALLVVHTRRAAEKCVRWMDDPDDFDREIPLWRALLAFGAFVTAQALFQALFSAMTSDAGVVLGLAFSLAGAVLAGLTFGGRRGLGPLAWKPARALHAPAGAALGVALGALGVGYGAWLSERGALPDTSGLEASPSLALVAVAAVVFAPLGEELFFRGWVQAAIAREYPRLGAFGAALLGAFAFAALHPGVAFPPVFAVGLVSGVLFARTRALVPSVLLHAAYNAVVFSSPLWMPR